MESNHLNMDVRTTQTIPQYFQNQNVFITGATGFMGKVLVEKLLRSCPNIGTIYVLVRSRKGLSGQERWNKVIECEIFDKCRIDKSIEKIKVIQGDALVLGLGLDPIDRKELIENVTIFYHLAASVKFNDSLQDAILMNVRGARETCKLVLEIKNLSVFLHVSTTYCQPDANPLKEELYPPQCNPHEAIQLAETMDSMDLKIITSKYCEKFPNTYSFTKCVSETLIKDMCEGKVQTVLLRPSIVSPSLNEPVKSWVDNFNGPIGMCFAGSKGVLRILNSKKESNLDYSPVDSAISAIIKATWYESQRKSQKISVYNCSNKNLFKITLEDQTIKAMAKVAECEIWSQPLIYPNIYFTMNTIWYWINIYFSQVFPALLVDTGLKIAGKKPMLLPLQRKLLSLVVPIIRFLGRDYNFENTKFIQLDDYLMPEDEEAFGNRMDSFDLEEYYIECFISITKVAKEKVANMKKNFVNYKRLQFIYYVWNTVWIVITGIFVYNHFLVPLFMRFCDYVAAL